MALAIFMPTLSPTMTEGHVGQWHKNIGDPMRTGDVLVDIETDKAVMEMEVVDDGTLAVILVPQGTQGVAVGTVLAIVREKGDTDNDVAQLAASFQKSPPPPKTPEAAVSPQPMAQGAPPQDAAPVVSQEVAPPPSGRRLISPLAKRLAAEGNVDITTLQGSGPRGRIIKQDIEAYHNMQSKAPPPTFSTGHPGDNPAFPLSQENSWQDLPLSPMRKVIARRLVESKQTIPHFYLGTTCHMEALLELRQSLNASLGKKISVNDFLVRALALALRDVPALNATWQDTHITRYHNVDLAVAVSVEGGLFTPVIRNAANMSFSSMRTTLQNLIEKARSNTLQPQEFQGGTCTLSNLGMFGIETAHAIINPPHGSILALGRAHKAPTVIGDALTVSTIMRAHLSVDHRVADGADGAKLLTTFQHYVENPLLLLY